MLVTIYVTGDKMLPKFDERPEPTHLRSSVATKQENLNAIHTLVILSKTKRELKS